MGNTELWVKKNGVVIILNWDKERKPSILCLCLRSSGIHILADSFDINKRKSQGRNAKTILLISSIQHMKPKKDGDEKGSDVPDSMLPAQRD